jgi:putative transposase
MVELRENLMKRIDEIHTERPALGQRKILKRLRKEGYTIGRKLVRRLMQEMGIHTVYPKENLSKRNFKEAIVPYLLRNVSVQLFIPFSPAYPGINHVNNAQNLAKYG